MRCSIRETNFHQWNIMMYKQCQTLLEGPIQAGDTALLIIESKINGKYFNFYRRKMVELINIESLKNKDKIMVKIEVLKNLEEGVQKYVSEELEQNIQQMSSVS